MRFAAFRQPDGVRRSGVLHGEDIHCRQNADDAVLAYFEVVSVVRQSGPEPSPSLTSSYSPRYHPPRIFSIGLNQEEHAARSEKEWLNRGKC